MDNKVAHGQIYDYMKRLRQFHGLDHIFGILTTYNEWKVFWLNDCDEAAVVTYVDLQSGTAVASTNRLIPAIPSWHMNTKTQTTYV